MLNIIMLNIIILNIDMLLFSYYYLVWLALIGNSSELLSFYTLSKLNHETKCSCSTKNCSRNR